MVFRNRIVLAACAVLACIVVRPVGAIIPVTDVGAIIQLISQLQVLEQQVETAHQQLEQARNDYAAITGDRGMERLLSGTVRNYLPPTWDAVQAASAATAGAFAPLAAGVRSAIGANAILSSTQLATLPAEARLAVQSDRQALALRQVLVQQALATTSARFDSLQQLVAAIGSASDQKSVLDLQARIAAEQGMLQNEQTKLQLIHEATLADESASRQRAHEQVVAGHGDFSGRFQPTVPAHVPPAR